jgi:hypothetical protein
MQKALTRASQVDEIPLAEISSVVDALTAGQHLAQGSLDAAENQQLFQHAIIIQTIPEGFNSGRTYHLKANSAQEYTTVLNDLNDFSRLARKRAESQSYFANLQRRVRRVYNSRPFQGLAIACILMVSPPPPHPRLAKFHISRAPAA